MDWVDLVYNWAPLLLGGILTAFWGRVEKVLKALKELGDVLNAITGALEDKEITSDELRVIKKEAGEALSAFKAILK